MKNLKSKLLGGIAGLGMTLSPLNSIAQETAQDTTEIPEQWETFIGTCGMFPNDGDLREIFESYFGIQGEAQKYLKNDFYLGVNGVVGFGKATRDKYALKARQVELMPMIVYKNGRFEIGAGPVLAYLKMIEEYDGDRIDDSSTSGLGLGGKAKFRIWDGEKLDIDIMGAYSQVSPSDNDIDRQLGTTKLGFVLVF